MSSAEYRLKRVKEVVDLYFEPDSVDKMTRWSELTGGDIFTAKKASRLVKAIVEEDDR